MKRFHPKTKRPRKSWGRRRSSTHKTKTTATTITTTPATTSTAPRRSLSPSSKNSKRNQRSTSTEQPPVPSSSKQRLEKSKTMFQKLWKVAMIPFENDRSFFKQYPKPRHVASRRPSSDEFRMESNGNTTTSHNNNRRPNHLVYRPASYSPPSQTAIHVENNNDDKDDPIRPTSTSHGKPPPPDRLQKPRAESQLSTVDFKTTNGKPGRSSRTRQSPDRSTRAESPINNTKRSRSPRNKSTGKTKQQREHHFNQPNHQQQRRKSDPHATHVPTSYRKGGGSRQPRSSRSPDRRGRSPTRGNGYRLSRNPASNTANNIPPTSPVVTQQLRPPHGTVGRGKRARKSLIPGNRNPPPPVEADETYPSDELYAPLQIMDKRPVSGSPYPAIRKASRPSGTIRSRATIRPTQPPEHQQQNLQLGALRESPALRLISLPPPPGESPSTAAAAAALVAKENDEIQPIKVGRPGSPMTPRPAKDEIPDIVSRAPSVDSSVSNRLIFSRDPTELSVLSSLPPGRRAESTDSESTSSNQEELWLE